MEKMENFVALIKALIGDSTIALIAVTLIEDLSVAFSVDNLSSCVLKRL